MKSLLVKLGVILIGLLVIGYGNVCAEGTWVLWEGTIELGLPIQWKILDAFPKYEQCAEKHKKNLGIIKGNFEKMGFHTHLLSEDTIVIEKVHSKNASGDIIVTQKCFPDTIDPRK
jgi:hypothetical protein